MDMSHIVKATKLKLYTKFHDDWSKQSVSNANSPNYANYEVNHALACLSDNFHKITLVYEIEGLTLVIRLLVR